MTNSHNYAFFADLIDADIKPTESPLSPLPMENEAERSMSSWQGSDSPTSMTKTSGSR